jgi:hypothetical protein
MFHLLLTMRYPDHGWKVHAVALLADIARARGVPVETLSVAGLLKIPPLRQAFLAQAAWNNEKRHCCWNCVIHPELKKQA